MPESTSLHGAFDFAIAKKYFRQIIFNFTGIFYFDFIYWCELIIQCFEEMKKDDLYFQGKYRIPSARLKDWDYRNPALYFVTICTKNMILFFGQIKNGIMQLNNLGQFASEYMISINTHKDNAMLINHIVMPNHVHAIIELKNKKSEKKANKFGPLLPGSLSSLINHYKGRVTKYANNNNLPWNGWHERFHDHIIRDINQYEKIYNYITTNPLNWKSDRYFRH